MGLGVWWLFRRCGFRFLWAVSSNRAPEGMARKPRGRAPTASPPTSRAPPVRDEMYEGAEGQRKVMNAETRVRKSSAAVREAEQPALSFDWGAIKWLCNQEIDPDALQTFGLVFINPGQQNPPHYHP